MISYTDLVGTMMSSMTEIVNTISYVLVAFCGNFLVVSSIMIGVITYISVLERKKEIGILRAIGASKGNISQVFNAEAFIIGLCAGLIGIGMTLLLLIPCNALIHSMAGSTDIHAVLPPANAVVLILLSVVLTLIGGLIPSRKAAKVTRWPRFGQTNRNGAQGMRNMETLHPASITTSEPESLARFSAPSSAYRTGFRLAHSSILSEMQESAHTNLRRVQT